ncbi:MAG: lipid A biosynthesis acyltransferase [Betaproteobacteria bacterium]|nr:lipid A biosynthesis acyltransferase [Betaproteobacteria bacterium]
MTRLVIALMWLGHFLPLGILAALGNAVGAAAFWLIPERRRVTRVNLEKCFPAKSVAERERLARAHFRAFCRSFVERGLLWWASRERIERTIRVEGLEHLRALRGAPAILFAPHFVGMDAGFTRLCCELNMVGMYSQQKDRLLSALLWRGRNRFGEQRAVSRQAGVRALIAGMREGRPLYYLPDQDYGARDALFVPFFGLQAATVPGLARLARITGARILPCLTRILPGGAGYRVTIEPPWQDFPTGDLHADTRRMNAYIEHKVQEMPEQYLWMHKRFKTRPPGEARLY